ncbi:hypothetical protein CY35_13G029100 [Sphagnum magellanicum]|nr:hypothetical protein CY35_13G029100 [Sphagnum magellanicum]
MFLPEAIATVYNCRAASEPAAVLNHFYPICNGLLSIHQRTAQTARACNKLHTRASDSSVQGVESERDDAGQQQQHPVLVVVGGGAAGIFGALQAKTVFPQMQVIVLEKGKLLSKVRISGGGRCNVTTGLFVEPLALAEQYPRGHKELRGSFFRSHGPRDTVTWFSERGVVLKTEEDGRMFPVTDSSTTIVDCLMNETHRLGVVLQTRASVSSISINENGKFALHLVTTNGASNEVAADYVLLATGSSQQGYGLAVQLGHSIVEPQPSLFTFKVKDTVLTELAGISLSHIQAELELPGQKRRDPHLLQTGPLLITHWGLSGPLILRLSAWAARYLHSSNYQGTLWVDFAPSMDVNEVFETLVNHKISFPTRQLGGPAPGKFLFVRRFWHYLLQRESLDKTALWATVPKKSLWQLATLLKRCAFLVSGKGEFKDEFVTAGGVPLTEVDLKTMESKLCPHLFFAGEVLNIDGITGGFNFQNAWTGGYISGMAIASLASKTFEVKLPSSAQIL